MALMKALLCCAALCPPQVGLGPGMLETGQMVAALRKLGFDYVFGERERGGGQGEWRLFLALHLSRGQAGV